MAVKKVHKKISHEERRAIRAKAIEIIRKGGSIKDATVTAAFGCLAAKFSSLVVGPNRIVFRKEF
jgi:hypothetical protein